MSKKSKPKPVNAQIVVNITNSIVYIGHQSDAAAEREAEAIHRMRQLGGNDRKPVKKGKARVRR